MNYEASLHQSHVGGLRAALESLPFVSTTPTGLNFWTPPASRADPVRAFRAGRHYAALWLALMRDTGNAGLLYHLNAAYRPALRSGCRILDGLLYEFGRTVASAPRDAAPVLLCTADIDFRGMSPEAAVQRLPWVATTEDGEVDSWAVQASGEWEEDRARGRYFGAVAARFMQQTGWITLWSAQPETPEAHEEIIVGATHALGEVMIAASPTSTSFQKNVADARQAESGIVAWDRLPDLTRAL